MKEYANTKQSAKEDIIADEKEDIVH